MPRPPRWPRSSVAGSSNARDLLPRRRRPPSPLGACGDDAPDVAPSASSEDTSGSAGTSAGSASETTSAAVTTEAGAPTTEAAPATTVDLAAAIGDRIFLSTSVEGYELVYGTNVELTFEGENLGATAGCNQMSSTWSLDGDVLVAGPMAMTQMACDAGGLDGPGHVAVRPCCRRGRPSLWTARR